MAEQRKTVAEAFRIGLARAAKARGGMSEAWLTKRELALRLKVSTRTIERLQLPFTRVGGQNRCY